MEKLNQVPLEIENYCLAQSTLPSALCSELAEYTRANVEMSVMLTGPLVGSFLSFLIKTIGARTVLEIGCYTGYSALYMAESLSESGRVISLDVDPSVEKIAKKFG